jgi:hypothetical protein
MLPLLNLSNYKMKIWLTQIITTSTIHTNERTACIKEAENSTHIFVTLITLNIPKQSVYIFATLKHDLILPTQMHKTMVSVKQRRDLIQTSRYATTIHKETHIDTAVTTLQIQAES